MGWLSHLVLLSRMPLKYARKTGYILGEKTQTWQLETLQMTRSGCLWKAAGNSHSRLTGFRNPAYMMGSRRVSHLNVISGC